MTDYEPEIQDEEPTDEGTGGELTLKILDASGNEAKEDAELKLRRQALRNIVAMHHPVGARITDAVQHKNRTWISGTHVASTITGHEKPFMLTVDEDTIQMHMSRIRPDHVAGKRII